MTGWTSAPLGDICPAKPIENPGLAPEEPVWQLNLDAIESNSGRVTSKLKAPVAQAGSSTHWFDKRHVLYSKLRPYLNKVVMPDETGIATTELIPLQPDSERLDKGYLAYYLRSEAFVNWVSGKTAGAKMPRVSMKDFRAHEIPLPPRLEEQKRIAAILDKADAIRRKRQQAIDLADEFLRSVFLEMFGTKRGQETDELGNLCKLIGGSSLPAGEEYDGQKGGSLLVKVGDMNLVGNEEVLSTSREWLGVDQGQSYCPAGAVIIPKRGGAIGTNKKRLLARPSLIDPNLMGIAPVDERISSEFIFQWFRLFDLTRLISGSAVPQLNKKDLVPLKIPIPKPAELKAFSNSFFKAAALREIQKAASDVPLFEALSPASFQG